MNCRSAFALVTVLASFWGGSRGPCQDHQTQDYQKHQRSYGEHARNIGACVSRATADPLPPGALLRFGTQRMLHATYVRSVTFSPKDRFIASADHGGVVRVWETATGRLVAERVPLTGRGGTEVEFSPDGRLLAIGGFYPREIALWDFRNDELVRELPANGRSLAFSADGTHLASAGQDTVTRLWDWKTGKVVKEFTGHKSALHAVALSPDSRLIASGGGGDGTGVSNNEIRVWDIASGRQIAELHEDNNGKQRLRGWTYALSFSPDSVVLAAAGPYAVHLYNIATQKQTYWFDDLQYDVAFATEDHLFVAGGAVGVYDCQSGSRKVKTVGKTRGLYRAVAFSHDGRLIVSGNDQGQIQLWDAKSGKHLPRRWGHNSAVRDVAFSADGSMVASVSRKDTGQGFQQYEDGIRLWGTSTGAELRTIDVKWKGPAVWWNDEGSTVLFAPYGRELITWTYDANVLYYRLGTFESHRLPLYPGNATLMAFSPDGLRVAAVYEQMVRVFELDGAKLLAEFNAFEPRIPPSPWVSAVAFSPDKKTLAIGAVKREVPRGPAMSVHLWDIQRNKVIRHLREGLSPPGGLCFSHDGALLAASPSHENSFRLWRTIDGIEFHDLKLTGDHHGRGPRAMAFSPNDKLFAAADEQGGVILWEVATGDQLRTLAGHIRPVTSLAFSPDGKWLLSGSEDTTALLWDVAGDGRKRVTLTEAELAAYWQGLAATDPDVVEAAKRRLLQAPEQTVTMLDQRLTAGQPLNMEELPDCIAQLVGEDPTVSLQAEAKLRDFGKKASPTLFEALADARSPVARRRIEDTLAAIGRHPIPPDQLRRSRGITLLELIGTDEAQKSLERLAQVTPPTPTSRDAAQALARLKSRIKRSDPLQR